MAIVAFRIHTHDNVATLLADAPAGPIAVQGGGTTDAVTANEPIELGHKVALADIAEGATVVKFGVAIGLASRPIRRGDWVHLHNCRSAFDARSGTLDLHTGAATDTRYE
ncbi:hydrolase [Siculibacillus lacustris]|uniref:Hydrolase n=1 Tax=Siculibacillus lacustris TaxID=1549641 RepID=A0A4Q9VRG9_9HYPH|nr:UxaA family hydrolase [Siculibacillus lacustris]TBW37637.1 hydrolase [Siculibacillus lacustris]